MSYPVAAYSLTPKEREERTNLELQLKRATEALFSFDAKLKQRIIIENDIRVLCHRHELKFMPENRSVILEQELSR